MRRVPLLLLLSAAVIIGLAWSVRPRAVGADSSNPPEAPGKKEAIAVRGVGSCAAAACHGGNGPAGSVGSEYSTWADGDPHARAYSVLFDDRSRAMLRLYRQLGPRSEPHPEKDPLCLRCHVQPDLDAVPHRDGFSASDGVGCESCHGPADRWLARHHLPGWKEESAAARAELGWVDTKNLRTRAKVCAACHVGRGDMDVNHDLIAAGHPRLRFEYGAYLANYRPKHWSARADRDRHPDFEARAWLLGQLTSAEAALKLLRHRAEHADATDDKARTPWPEFAEYNCAACHHDLTSPSFRQGPGSLGTLPWGTWYFAALPALADGPARLEGGRLDLGTLSKLMQYRRPDEKRVAAEAGRLAGLLHAWGDRIDRRGVDRDGLRALLADLAQDRGGLPNWEGMTQRYLGLAAVHHGLADQGAAPPGLQEALLRLRDDLAGAFSRGRDTIYDTPSHFRPDRLGADLERIRERLK